jgi:phage recombination protein Bet
MTALLAADACPACRGVHGQPTDWPVCPDHGHWLYVVSGPLKTGVWTYACQAPNCTHTRTQREKATMTATNETNRAALAIRGDQDMFTSKQLAMLAQLGIDGAPKADLAVFLYRCQVTGLDPFARQITMIKRREKTGRDERQDKWTIQTGIDGYRVIARRAARDAGIVLSYGDTVWYDGEGCPHDVWVDPEQPPAAAKVVVYCDGKPFPGVARFRSFAAYTRDGKLMANWATMPEHMIAKCAEAQALRRAFPQDLEGIFTSEELPQPGPRPAHFAAEQVPAPPPRRQRKQPQPEPPEPDMRALRDEARAHLDRLGLDEDERDNYMRDLTGEQDLTALTVEDLAKAVAALESCEDIAQLRDITAPVAGDPQ